MQEDKNQQDKEKDRSKEPPVFPAQETNDGDKPLAGRDPTGGETGEDLNYNDEAGSFELDTEQPLPPDAEYQHPDPHDTAVPGALDHMSTYDEANKYTPNESSDNPDRLADQLESIDEEDVRDRFIELSDTDEKLAETHEDERGDLDEEGYPKRDDAGGDPNPITDPDHSGPKQ